MRTTYSEDGGAENPDLSIFIAEDKSAQPFALLFSAPLPVQDRHMFAAADDTERVDIFGKISRQFTICELVARYDLIHGARHRIGKILYEFSVFSFVRMFDEVAP